jgi:hypothetical protein
VLTPRHSNKTIPASATHSRNRVRVRKTHIALVGGSCAFADFHVTPPLGRSMATMPPWPQHHQRKDCCQFDRRSRARRRELSSEGMGELNRKLWPLDGMIEEVESAQGGSYFTATILGEPSHYSHLARLMKAPLSVLEAGSRLLHEHQSYRISKLHLLGPDCSHLCRSGKLHQKSESWPK